MKRAHTITLWGSHKTNGGNGYRWNRKAGNGLIVGQSSQWYRSKASALKNLHARNSDWEDCRVVDLVARNAKPKTLTAASDLSREPLS